MTVSVATLEAMFVGIRAAQPYVTVFEVGREITNYARRLGYGVVREYQGHGVGREFHTEPGVTERRRAKWTTRATLIW